MTREEAIKALRDILIRQEGDSDTKYDHMDADDVLCRLLDSLGYEEVTTIYGEIYKWYD